MQHKKKTILFATSSRSDFASLEPLLRRMKGDEALNAFLFVTGDHYAPEAGNTYKKILEDGYRIGASHRITKADPAGQVAEVVSAVAGLLRAKEVACAVVCGDRKETFAIAIACALGNVPLFHIHGGDVTFGMIDDAMRHAITKLSAIHFAATPLSARRIRQMGEETWRVFLTGSPDVDGLKGPLPERETLLEFGVEKKKYALLLLNPETLLTKKGNSDMTQTTIQALKRSNIEKVIVLYPNNDAASDAIRGVYDKHTGERFILCSKGLPRRTYLALLKNATFLIGNSSSGITEAASFKTPVINVGQRQDGRERNINIIDVSPSIPNIEKAIRRARSVSFVRSLSRMRNVYGNGEASQKIHKKIRKILTTYSAKKMLYKRFTLL